MLWVGPESGRWAVLLKWKKGYVAPPHKHLSAAFAFILSGKLQVRNNVYNAGDFLHETNGMVHGATTALEDTEYLFFCDGPVLFFDKDNFTGYRGWEEVLRMQQAAQKQAGRRVKGLERLAEVARAPALHQRGAIAPLSITIRSGDTATTVGIAETVTVIPGARADAAFALIASPDAWAKFAAAVPPVGYQSLVGMVRMGTLRIEGDVLAFGRNMLFLEQLLPGLRPAAAGRAAARVSARRSIEPIVGRYLRLDFNGRPHRIYFEEAGAGAIPLVCLHTAGSDGRQYRALLNDPDITRRFRVIAFDLPWHGKSSPPPGFERETYQLTTDLYVDTVMAVCRALGARQAGGDRLLDRRPRRAAPGAAPWRLFPRGHRPAVGDPCRSRRRHAAARPAPAAPARRAWPGSGGWLGRLPDRADLALGRRLGDAVALHAGRAGRVPGRPALLFHRRRSPERPARQLDTRRCPLHLLTGEYDLSATPELTAELPSS